jgi:hypothetical protein
MIGTVIEIEPESPDGLDYERYAAARAAANSISADQSKFIDQTILTLGGGGLGITLTFLHDFVTVPAAPYFLYFGDGLLLLSIMAVLVSLYTSQKSISDQINQLDTAARNDFGDSYTEFMKTPFVNASAKYTALLNKVAMITVTTGMFFLALFVSQNLTKKEQPKVTTHETKIIRPGHIDSQKGAVIHAPAVAPKPASTQQAPAPQPTPKK